MKRRLRVLFVGVLLATTILETANSGAARPKAFQNQRNEEKSQQRLVMEVRHQLVMLPWYSVFDNLEYKVEGDKVVLMGQVTRPVLKSDAEGAVKSVEGVSTVENNIEVLPPSPMDDQIRRAVYRSIYGFTGLSRYSVQAVPSIHIIVKGGHVALEGVVDTQADKDLANVRANQVPNVFSVDNHLRVSGAK
jgi:hyperosmotically inducible periplasmic protein